MYFHQKKTKNTIFFINSHPPAPSQKRFFSRYKRQRSNKTNPGNQNKWFRKKIGNQCAWNMVEYFSLVRGSGSKSYILHVQLVIVTRWTRNFWNKTKTMCRLMIRIGILFGSVASSCSVARTWGSKIENIIIIIFHFIRFTREKRGQNREKKPKEKNVHFTGKCFFVDWSNHKSSSMGPLLPVLFSTWFQNELWFFYHFPHKSISHHPQHRNVTPINNFSFPKKRRLVLALGLFFFWHAFHK